MNALVWFCCIVFFPIILLVWASEALSVRLSAKIEALDMTQYVRVTGHTPWGVKGVLIKRESDKLMAQMAWAARYFTGSVKFVYELCTADYVFRWQLHNDFVRTPEGIFRVLTVSDPHETYGT